MASFESGAHPSGLPAVALRAGEGGQHSACVLLHGGHVVSWAVDGVEQLFVSAKAMYAPPKAVRGGIPVCWPQFSDLGPCATQHGFARNLGWTLAGGGVEEEGAAWAELRLVDSPETRAAWPHAFALTLRVTLSADGALRCALRALNPGDASLTFTCALHTYLRVDDVRAGNASVRGLAGAAYLDNLGGRERKAQPGDRQALTFVAETDRIYLSVPDALHLHCGGSGRGVAVRTRGLPDAVVWTPWEAKGLSMADLGDEWPFLVCVEAAAVERPVVLQPGEAWEGVQTLTAERTA